MNSKRIALGIGIALVVVAVFTAHAAAHRAYFDPQHSNATIDNTTTMDLYVEIDAGETLLVGDLQILFDPTRARVTENWLLCQYVNPTGAGEYCWATLSTNFDSERNGHMWGGVSTPQESKYYDPPGPDPLGWYWVNTEDGLIHGPATVPCGTYVIEANGTPGVSPFNFGFEHMPSDCPACQKSLFANGQGTELDINWENGTFTHLAGASEPFSMFLPEGWNLISLPLTATNNSVSVVLSGVSQDAVKQYDATTKTFETATTMDPGTGYFVHVTDPSGSTWTYDGWPETSTSPGLVSGLNMIGVPNCTMSVGDAMGSADYRYVARWDASLQEYKVYNPSAPSAFHGFTEMAAGEGYFVSATNDNSSFAISC